MRDSWEEALLKAEDNPLRQIALKNDLAKFAISTTRSSSSKKNFNKLNAAGHQALELLLTKRSRAQHEADEDMRRGLGGMSLSRSVNEAAKKIFQPDVDQSGAAAWSGDGPSGGGGQKSRPPPFDPNDEAQARMFYGNVHHNRARETIRAALDGTSGFENHLFNEVYVGYHWVRLNYSTLGQAVLDTHYFAFFRTGRPQYCLKIFMNRPHTGPGIKSHRRGLHNKWPEIAEQAFGGRSRRRVVSERGRNWQLDNSA